MLPPLPRSLAIGLLCCLSSGILRAEPLRIMGSPIVGYPISFAVKVLIRQGMEIENIPAPVPVGLAALGGGAPRIALLARHLEGTDRAEFPELQLTEIELGRQVASFCVSTDVWKGGIHSISAEQARKIFEGRVKNWKELGGPDEKISFFNWEEGQGMWGLVAEWLYESTGRTPKGKFTAVSSNEEARNAIEFIFGGIAVMSPKMARDGAVHPLALVQAKGAVAPTVENIASGAYPLTRPLCMVIDDQPTGSVKKAIDFLLSPEGQEFFSKAGHYTITEIKAAQGQP